MSQPINGLHIEPTNLCTLKCSECARTQFINQWPQHWRNHNLDIDQLLEFLDIDLRGLPVLLCGNYGDPIYHPKFAEFVSGLKSQGAQLTIITNGSYKTRAWWGTVVTYLDSQDQVVFSIDGLPENFAQYRVNADWESIQQGIQSCVEAECQTAWKYIPFGYNQNSIELARELSQQLGMDSFIVDPSDRFDRDQTLAPTVDLVSEKLQLRKTAPGIKPMCSSGREHFISATGHYSSCCYLTDHRYYYKNEFGRNQDEYSIVNTRISELLNRPKVIDFYKEITINPSCRYVCAG